MNYLKHNEGGGGNIITDIKPELVKNECENIISRLERKCPRCNTALFYSTVGNKDLADRKGNLCRSCTFLDRHPSMETRRKMSSSHVGFKHTQFHRKRISGHGNPMYGIHRYNNLNPFYGKKHTDDTRRKMRIATCHKILLRTGNGRLSTVGNGEKQYFDQFEKEQRWNGKRQYFLEYLGYFVDYYEPNLNIVVEYDEPRHYRQGALRERDVVRMKQIKEYLGCEFWRYDAYRMQLAKF